MPHNAQSPDRPRNFVFILADDLGVVDLSAGGSDFYESPNIDRIAREGMLFEHGYATCQVCSPSRASIMTGKYTPRVGITDWIGAHAGTDWKRNTKLLPAEYEHQLSLDETSIAAAMREGGYTTFFAGKWHLGKEGYWPEDHGFDINVGGHDRGSPPGGYFAPYNNPKMGDGPDGECLCIRLGDETAAFIEAHQDKPFFAYLSFYAVHGPIQTTQVRWAKYRDKALAGPQPDNRFIMDRRMPVRQVQDNPVYAGLIEMMDDGVGVVLDKLDELGLAENTVVIFTSDNGGVSSGDSFSSSMLPYRGGKGRQWEGGIREPYYVRVPGMTAPGSTCDTPVTGTDFYPTILELAGLPLRPKQHLDGVSIVPLLQGGTIAPRDLYWHYPHYGNQGGDPTTMMRSGMWKLIHYWEDDRDELYDLATDMEEQNDVAQTHPTIAAEMRRKMDAWLKEVGARPPTPNPNYDPELAKQQAEEMRTVRMANLERQHAGFLAPDYKPDATWWGSTVD